MDLWTDERMQLAHMQGSFADMLRTLPQREYFGWLEGDFYLIYPFFKIFGANKWGLMLPHLLATVVGFYLLYLIAQRYFQTWGAFIVCFAVVVFNATLIHHALEIRSYAVFPTLVLAFFYFSDKFWEAGFAVDLKHKIGLGLLTVVLIWFHVYGLFAVGFITLYFLGAHRANADFPVVLRRAAAFFAAVGAIALPFWVYCVFFNHLQYGIAYKPGQDQFAAIQRDVYQFIPNPLLDLTGFLKGVFGNLMGYKLFYPLYGGLLLAWVLPQAQRLKQIGFFLTLIVLPIVFLNYLDAKNGYWFVQRQFIWTMPLLALLLGWCWESVFVHLRSKRK